MDFEDDLPAELTMAAINPTDVEGDRVHFYRRIRATMIAKRIEGIFDEASIKTIFHKKH